MTHPLLPTTLATGRFDWYLTRASGTVALLLLSVAVALGVADVRRWGSPRWPRFLVDRLHRNASLLALVFLVLHVLTSVADSFAPISLAAAFVPFVSPYRPFWLGLGAVALDLMVAVIVTSLLRRRLGQGAWRATHWLVYACWPIALLHTFGTGSDVQQGWLLALSAGCLTLVLAAVVARTVGSWHAVSVRARALALGGAGAFTAGLLLWLPSGPLGREWARRSGTPAALLGHPVERSKIVVSP
jgi:sulfoxide reductase heme-binding subunit YedZ